MDRFQNTRQPDWDWWGELWSDPIGVLEKVGVAPSETLVDVGCGNGYFTIPAATLVEETVYAVDLDESLLDQLSVALAERDITTVECRRCDARALSEHVPPVDVALVANTFHGVEEQTAFAKELYRTLTDGGRLIIINWHGRPRSETVVAGVERGPPEALRMTPAETTEAVTGVGFQLTREIELPPYHYALVFEKRD